MQSDLNRVLTTGLLIFFMNLAIAFCYFINPFAILSMLENVRSAINNLIGFNVFWFSSLARLMAQTPPMEYPCKTLIFILRLPVTC